MKDTRLSLYPYFINLEYAVFRKFAQADESWCRRDLNRRVFKDITIEIKLIPAACTPPIPNLKSKVPFFANLACHLPTFQRLLR